VPRKIRQPWCGAVSRTVVAFWSNARTETHFLCTYGLSTADVAFCFYARGIALINSRWVLCTYEEGERQKESQKSWECS
jgi:hypothetical protein